MTITVRRAVLRFGTALLLVTAACGGDDGGSATPPAHAPDPTRDAGPDAESDAGSDAGPDSGDTADTADAGAFPVTVPHAFGETVIDAEPQRVVTWGWASADAAIALDVVPVAIPHQAYGGDDEGVLPWIREALEERGADVPIVLPDMSEPPFEAIAQARPDLIVAVYSGISDTDYALLSEIAPTIAYPDQPWATPWHDVIRIIGTALGRADAAEALLADIDDRVTAAGAAHPELSGLTVAMVWNTADTFYVYEPADPRVGFAVDLGMVSAPSVAELSTGESTFYYSLSHERLEELTSDVLVSFADTPEVSQEFLDSAPAQLMEQVRAGTVAEVVGPAFVAAVSPPTALSLVWGLDDYVALLSDAAQAARADS